MNHITKNIIKRQILPIVASSMVQPLYRCLHRCSLAAMNIGTGSDVESSGELFALRYVARQLKGREQPVIFDVGANVGKWTLAAAATFPPGSAFHCFEPSANTCKVLAENLADKCAAVIHCFGAGDSQAMLSLYRPEQSSVASLYHRTGHNDLFSEKTVSEQVSIRRIDAVCDELRLESIDFLKFDTEGHELAALRGCGDMLAKGAITFIQFEFGGCNIESRTYFRDFWDMLSSNYRIFRVLPRGLYELNGYEEWMEQFTTTNFVAVSRSFRHV